MTTGGSNISTSSGNTTLIVGATSSLAQALCRVLAKRRHALVLAGRDEAELRLLADDVSTRFGVACRVLVADLLAPGFSAEQLVAQAGAFDQAIITVGDMGSNNFSDPELLHYITHINYTVPAQIATSAAEYLRQSQSGSVVIISSVAGDRGRQSNYLYGSAKAALIAFASGLRNRMHKDDVHIMTVKPGFIDTPMTWGMKSPLIASRDYVAEKIIAAMDKKKEVIYVPWFWQIIMLIICAIPEPIFKKLKL